MFTIKQIKEMRKDFFKRMEEEFHLKLNDKDICKLESLKHTSKKLEKMLEEYNNLLSPFYFVYDNDHIEYNQEYHYVVLDSKKECQDYISKQFEEKGLIYLGKSTFHTNNLNVEDINPCEYEITNYVGLDYGGEMKNYLCVETYGKGMSFDELYSEIVGY